MPITVSLRRLFAQASFVGCADIPVVAATEHSSQCGPNVLFAALPGTRHNGRAFVAEAVELGAQALLVDRPLPDVPVRQCIVADVRRSYAELTAALAGSPSLRLKLAGVTGTNGKTTVSWMIRSVLQNASYETGLLGTVEYFDGVRRQPATLTTPNSVELSSWLQAMVRNKMTHAAIELSSHALAQDRSAGTRLNMAVVTNVTQDHFDYHGNYEAYLAAKSRIVEHLKPGGCLVVNCDDPGSAALPGQVETCCDIVSYGLENDAGITADIIEESLAGTRFLVRAKDDEDQRWEFFTPLVGRHNVSNCLAAVAAGLHFGMTLKEIAAGLESLETIPGRLERIAGQQPFDVFVDYAHTDDALRRAVAALKELTPGRVICVFGAGGDRDRSKRPLLARAAAGADLAVVTSDNPRTEDPREIIDHILAGFPASGHRPLVEVDRAEAIQMALTRAEPGDCVLIAGKGHETEQIIGTSRTPFDDRQVAGEFLAERFGPIPPAAPSPAGLKASA